MNGIYGASGATKFTARRVSVSTEPLPGAPGAASARMPVAELPVPSIKDVARVDRDTPPSQQNAVTATFILKTSPHATLGNGYVIVKDQTQPAFLEPLDRLAKFHHGSIIHVKDLGSLRTDAAGRDQFGIRPPPGQATLCGRRAQTAYGENAPGVLVRAGDAGRRPAVARLSRHSRSTQCNRVQVVG